MIMKKKPNPAGMLLALVLVQAFPILFHYGEALAITVPATGSFAYDIYDIAVNSILKGPIGFVGGVGAIVFGAIEAMRGRVLEAIPAILGGAALLKADTIVQTLGCIV
jgi:hypothetical protein